MPIAAHIERIKKCFRQYWFVALAVFVLGFLTGMPFDFPGQGGALSSREHNSSFKFINPLLLCGDTEESTSLDNQEAGALEDKLSDLVERLKRQGTISDAGIYFRQLNDGPWVGVDESLTFTPGSLLKVPLAISVYKIAE